MPKCALVTGAYGFIGRYIAKAAAARGYIVAGLGHGDWTRDEWRTFGLSEWHAVDVTVESLIMHGGSPDAIFHCAGSGFVGYSMAHPFQDFQRTVETTAAVLEFGRLQGTRAKIIFPSSPAVYGAASVSPISVEYPLKPVSVYGVHKKIAEDLCRSYARHFGIRCAVVRLFSVQGIGLRKQLFWDACRKICIGEMTFSGSGEETRDWLNVEDAADLLILAVDYADSDCPVVNGGSGKGVKVREVLNKIAACLGCTKGPQFSGVRRIGDPMHFAADITEARAWGWTPKHNLVTDICDYVNWFKKGAL
jgi:UDP-glucose 4-epimerase